jgi:hypothetical protein
MSDLKPCPFCGGLMTTWLDDGHAIHRDFDSECPSECPIGHVSISVSLWNTRALPAAPDGTENVGIAGRDWRSGEHQKWETARALPAVRADDAAIREADADAEARGLNLAIERVTAFLSRTDDAAHQLAVDAMLEDMQNDNHESEIRLYRQVILALINNPGKEVMPSEAWPNRAALDTAPAGLSAGGGADYDAVREAIQQMVGLEGEYHVEQESADRALDFLDDMEAKNCPAPRLLVEDGSVILTWVIGGWKLYQYCDEEETQSFHWQGPPATDGGA